MALLLAPTARASDGDLDPSFGSGGLVASPSPGNVEIASALSIDSSDRLVVMGYPSGSAGPHGFTAARYTTLGGRDTSFGGTGIVTTSVGSFHGTANDLALTPDGGMLLAGEGDDSRNAYALVRYKPNGNLEGSFGSGGVVAGPLASTPAYAIAIDSSGRIYIAGRSWIRRLTPSGDLDTSFGSGGTANLPDSRFTPLDLTIDAAGRIDVVSERFDLTHPSTGSLELNRFSPRGVLDTSFGSGGTAASPLIGPGAAYGANTLAIDPRGRILLAGTRVAGSHSRGAVARFTPAGALDTTFGSTGVVTGPSAYGLAGASSVAVDSRGRIVVAGSDSSSALLFRVNPDGSIDRNFGRSGLVETPPPHAFRDIGWTSVAIDDRDRVNVAGAAGTDSSAKFLLGRYIGYAP